MAKVTQERINRVINQELRGRFMQKVMFEKGWSLEMAREHVMGYLTCGRKISIAQYMKEAF
ncbi:hypothetical protein NW995_002467 [Salmonella enterica]|nr:hypothetical protein [Salmonella enterica]